MSSTGVSCSGAQASSLVSSEESLTFLDVTLVTSPAPSLGALTASVTALTVSVAASLPVEALLDAASELDRSEHVFQQPCIHV